MKTNLLHYIDQLEQNINSSNQLNSNVSASNVGWHIEHILLTINGILIELARPKTNDFKPKFSLLKSIIFLTKTIPRGKAKAPKIVQPADLYDVVSLQNHINKTKAELQKLESIHKENYFNHPYFGGLKRDKTVLFLEIHTNHHLKIIKDILK